jgi:hypothetical protein
MQSGGTGNVAGPTIVKYAWNRGPGRPFLDAASRWRMPLAFRFRRYSKRKPLPRRIDRGVENLSGQDRVRISLRLPASACGEGENPLHFRAE